MKKILRTIGLIGVVLINIVLAIIWMTLNYATILLMAITNGIAYIANTIGCTIGVDEKDLIDKIDFDYTQW